MPVIGPPVLSAGDLIFGEQHDSAMIDACRAAGDSYPERRGYFGCALAVGCSSTPFLCTSPLA